MTRNYTIPVLVYYLHPQGSSVRERDWGHPRHDHNPIDVCFVTGASRYKLIRVVEEGHHVIS